MRLLMGSTLAIVIGLTVWAMPRAAETPQVTVPRVVGTVVDAVGSTLPGATVELMSGTRVVRTTTTDEKGGFAFENVRRGSYQLRVRLVGFIETTQALAIGPGPLAPLRLTLAVASATEKAMLQGQTNAGVDAMASA